MKILGVAKVILSIVCVGMLLGCGDGRPVSNQSFEVEIAPGEWLRLEGAGGRAWFRCKWNKQTIYWPGEYRRGKTGYVDVKIPVSLRSWNGELYLIYQQIDFNLGLTTYGYEKLQAGSTAFNEINRRDFPRQIATQNISMALEGVGSDENHNQAENLKVLRALDVSNRYFHNSTTGWIWYHLETGAARGEVDPSMNEALAFYAEFVKKYQPIALPTLLKE